MTTKERDHHDVDHCDGTNPRRIDFFLFMWVILKNAEVPGSGNTITVLQEVEGSGTSILISMCSCSGMVVLMLRSADC